MSEKPLNGHRAIKEWLEHPKGGPVIRAVFEKTGIDDATLAQMRALPLGGLPGLSQGRFPQELVDQLILTANDGAAPAEEEDLGATDARFEGKMAIVTGAASGIGLATLKRIVSEGGTVVAVDISEERLNAVAAAAPEGMVIPVVGDITNDDDVDRIVAAAGPRVDCLANINGIIMPTDGGWSVQECLAKWLLLWCANALRRQSNNHMARDATSRMWGRAGGAPGLLPLT